MITNIDTRELVAIVDELVRESHDDDPHEITMIMDEWESYIDSITGAIVTRRFVA